MSGRVALLTRINSAYIESHHVNSSRYVKIRFMFAMKMAMGVSAF